MVDDYKEPSVCDDCEIGDGWECQFCCSKCYEDFGECPNPDCDPMDIQASRYNGYNLIEPYYLNKFAN